MQIAINFYASHELFAMTSARLMFISAFKMSELRSALFYNNVAQITKLILYAESLKPDKQSSALQKRTVVRNWEKL